MSKWKPVKKGGPKKNDISRARQVGCVVWLALAMGMVLWLFYAIFSRPST
jgi:hypothetical protein